MPKRNNLAKKGANQILKLCNAPLHKFQSFLQPKLDAMGTAAYKDAISADYSGLIHEGTLLQPGQWVHGIVVFEVPYSNVPITIDIGVLNIDKKTIHVMRFDVSKFRDVLNY